MTPRIHQLKPSEHTMVMHKDMGVTSEQLGDGQRKISIMEVNSFSREGDMELPLYLHNYSIHQWRLVTF